MKKVSTDVTDEEVARARAQIKSSVLMSLESTSSRCEQLARQLMIFGRPIPPAEIVAKIEEVDTAAVARVARRLGGTSPTLTALGPISGVESYEKVVGRLA
jgi:predicted Zn-dependent peptidase